MAQMSVRYGRFAVLLWILLIVPRFDYAQEEANRSSPVPVSDLFYHLDRHLLGSFTYGDGIFHLAAIPPTYALIKTGTDWKWYTYANNHGLLKNYTAAVVGAFVPFVVPLTLYFYGRSAESRDLQITAVALAQAALLSAGIASTYKAFTGRRHPSHPDVYPTEPDYSGDWHFGFLRRGAYSGWPSSHTLVAFAMATTMTELYPENTLLTVISYAYASFIGIGVSWNIHWLSDAVAGALMGYSVGKTVGSGFRGLRDHESGNSPLSISILPIGISVCYTF